jgi:hypothetical protein
MLSTYEMYKEIQAEAPVNDDFLALCLKKFPIGTVVKILRTGYTGRITGTNNRIGFYSGSRYPLKVLILTSEKEEFNEAVGLTFEYSIDQLEEI